ncbi:MAG: 2-dehydropantoate 2-reductase [Candidatus Omnitrophota bacterium]|nr:2-dehydropantoate 2-reductase [Candidatus Omnitrophota bacterium]
MKIAVVGPGAMGCLISGYLKNKTKEEVWLYDKLPERARHIRDNFIKVETPNSAFQAKVNVTADAKEIGVCDLVMICVKSYSTEDACKEIKEMVGENTYVMTLQNGIGNVQILKDHFGEDKVVAGITNHGATLLGLGHVRHAGKGDTIIGRADGRLSGILKEIAGILNRAGFETKISKDIDSVIWSKLIINVGINALTAITRLNNGRLIEYEESRSLLRSAVQEATKIVKRKRIKLAYDDPIQKVESVCKGTAQNVSSMLQDVLNKRRTEIEFINGAIIRQGKALGIPTPVNEVLANLVRTIETSYPAVVGQSVGGTPPTRSDGGATK